MSTTDLDPITCRVQGDRIWIESPIQARRLIVGADDKDPGLAGRKWHDPVHLLDGTVQPGYWSVPATPTAAADIKRIFTDWPSGTFGNQAFADLLAQAREHARANELRHAEELPALPARARCLNWRAPCPSTLPGWHPDHVEPFHTDDADIRVHCPHCDAEVGSWLHQRQAYAVTAPRGRGILWLDPGMGKTMVAAALADTWETKRGIVLAPPAASRVWPDQLDWHSKRRWMVANHGGVSKRTGRPLSSPSAKGRIAWAEEVFAQAQNWGLPAMVVIPYQLLPYMKNWLYSIRRDLDFFAADESHYVKEPGGVWRRIAQAVADEIPHSIDMTGTLMPNSRLDAYAQVCLVDKAVFGTSFVTHRARYAIVEKETIYVGGKERVIPQVKGFRNEEEFDRRLASVTYRADDSVLDLPEFHSVTVKYRLSPACSKLYRDLEREFVAEIEAGTIVARNPLAKLMRLAQLANGHVTVERDCPVCGGYWRDAEGCSNCEGAGVIIEVGEKIDDSFDKALEEWLAGIPRDEPVVCFGRFTADLDSLQAVAEKQDRRYAELSGRRNDGLTESGTVPDWVDVDGVQIQAGAEGINLTRASQHAFLSVGFDNGKFEQALRRGRRLGQTRKGVWTHFIAELDDGEPTVNAVEYGALQAKTSAAAACAKAIREAHHKGAA